MCVYMYIYKYLSVINPKNQFGYGLEFAKIIDFKSFSARHLRSVKLCGESHTAEIDLAVCPFPLGSMASPGSQ